MAAEGMYLTGLLRAKSFEGVAPVFRHDDPTPYAYLCDSSEPCVPLMFTEDYQKPVLADSLGPLWWIQCPSGVSV